MTKLLSKNLLSPILVGIAVLTAGVYPARANPTSNESTTPQSKANGSLINSASSKVTNSLAVNVSDQASAEQIEQAAQAIEIKPGDWAYQTLQALSNKYSCGNAPTGDKILSREEFATSLNSCVTSIEQLVARRKPRRAIKKRRPAPAAEVAPPAPEALPPAPEPAPISPPTPAEAPVEAVTQQDLDRLKQLVQSFSTELQSLDARIEALDKKTAELKAQSFSTTTKLNGEVIFGVTGYNTGRSDGITSSATANPPNTSYGTTGNILSNRVRLNFDTSFTGKDKLRTRLQSRNTPSLSGATGTNMTRLGYDGDESNNTSVSLLQYSFPLSSQTKIIAETIGSEFNENMYTFNPILASSGSGSISRFGRFNPVYRLSGDGASLSVNHKFSDGLDLAVGYAVPGINVVANPASNNGLFNGSNSIIGQLNFRPVEDLNLGLIYARSYSSDGNNITGGTGSSAANRPFGTSPTTANHYSFLTSYKISPNFVFSGWAGFTEATREATGGGRASSSNYAISLAFPDFGQKGNNLAFVLGIPPKLNSQNSTATGAAAANTGTSYHLEALYKVKLSDNLEITPGLLLITNPNHVSNTPTEYVGTVRTTFKF